MTAAVFSVLTPETLPLSALGLPAVLGPAYFGWLLCGLVFPVLLAIWGVRHRERRRIRNVYRSLRQLEYRLFSSVPEIRTGVEP